MLFPSLRSTSESCLNIAHRGACGQFPENTMRAFRGAVACHADIIELDVHLTKDRVPVIRHNATLDAHSNGHGLIKDYDARQIKTLDAGSWFAAEFTGERIPLLEEVLAFARNTIPLNIEIKPAAVRNSIPGGVEACCLQLVHDYGMADQVIFSSFDGRALHHLKSIDPDISVGVLYLPSLAAGKSPCELVAHFDAESFHCWHRQLSKDMITNLKRHQIPLMVYTVNRKHTMKKMLQQGVQGIFTDHPARLHRLLLRQSD